jgi:exodeoxyribonuclease V gamma subunit
VRFGVGEVQAYVTGLLSGGWSRSRQWADVVRVGSLTRLRGVPSRVVAILGFDDDAFRSGRNNGDDVLGVDPRIGERDFGAEQRLGLLATLCSATDKLIVTANGHDVTNNKRVPLAVALEELLDAALAAGVGGDRVLDRPLVIDHARQEFDPVNVGLGSPDPSRNVGRFVEGPWTFDPTAPQVAAEILAGERGDGFAWPTLEGVGDPVDVSTCSIGDLVDAVRRPTRIYLRRGLQIAAPQEAQVAVDELPLWPSHLEESSLGLGLIDALRVGDPAAVGRWERLVRLQGRIPPGALGDRYLAQLRHEVDAMVAIAGDDWRDTQRIDIDIVVDSAGAAAAWTLRGSVDVVGTRVVSFRYSKGHPRHQLLPLVELAALSVHSPDTLWEAAVITRASDPKKTTDPWTAQFRLAGSTPTARLAVAHDVLHFAHATFVEATRAPVPLFERSSWRSADSGFAKDLETDLKDRSNALVFASDAEEDRKGFERWVRARGAALLELWERSHVPVVVPTENGGAA